MQRRQQVGCGLITLRDGRGWIAFDKTLDAEILGDSGIRRRGRRTLIMSVYRGRAEVVGAWSK